MITKPRKERTRKKKEKIEGLRKQGKKLKKKAETETGRCAKIYSTFVKAIDM